MSDKRTIILTHNQIERKIQRMAWEIYETNHLTEKLILIGIANNGDQIAKAIGNILKEISKIEIYYGHITIDKPKGFDSEVNLDCSIKLAEQSVILIDDVLNSGKTMLACMLPVVSQKPKKIQTAVLADRNHKAFPVHADIVGISLATTLQEHIWFEIESDNSMIVFLT